MRAALLCGLIASAFAPRAWAEADYLGMPPAYYLLDISADGRRAAASGDGGSPYRSVPGFFDAPYANSLFQPIAEWVENTYVQAELVSDDGSTIAGRGFPSELGGSWSGFRWDAVGGFSALAGFGQEDDRVAGISEDGSAIFGKAGGKAARWDDGVLSILSPPGYPDGLPATLLAERPDGKVIGVADGGAQDSVPPLFLSDGLSLEALWTPEVGELYATRASTDGSVVIGFFSDGFGHSFPFRWSDRPTPQFAQLTHLAINARALGTTNDGNVVVGISGEGRLAPIPVPDGPAAAFVWDPRAGFRFLADTLVAAGVPVPARGPRAAHSVAEDGITIVGEGSGGGFVARLPDPAPEPGAVACAIAVAIALAGWRRAHC